MPPNDSVKDASGVALLPGEVGAIVEHMQNGMAYCEMLFEDGQPCDFVYLYTNPAFESLTGLSGVIGRRVTDIIPGIRESDPQLFEIYGRVAKTGKPEKFETYVEALGMWFSITVYSPKTEHFVALFDVITERKQAEQNLLKANERLSLAQRTAGAGVWDWDILKGTLTWSDEFFHLFGLDPAAAPATFDTWRSVVHPDDLQRAEEVIMASIRDHVPLFNEYRIVLPSGEVRWVDAFGDATYDAEGNALRMIGICIDSTGRKAAEQALEATRVAAIEETHLLETIMHALPVGVAIVDERGGTIRSNAEYGRIWGNPRPPVRSVDDYDAYKARWVDTGQPVQPHEWASALALQTGKLVANQLLQIQRFDGTQAYVLNSAAPIRDAYDNIVGSAVVIQDITELKQAEMALRDADQHKDEFLAMLAHELRNPLAPIRNAAHVLGQLGLDEPRLRWAQGMITQQVVHLNRMVDDLLDVSRIARGKINLRIERLNLDELVRLARESVEEEMAAKGHRFAVHLPEARVKLDGDPVRLVQVLHNLLANAAKYTADGGSIELSAKTGAGEVVIEVRDTGMGIAPDLLPDIFDLFRQGERTLDRSQGGLGIGLTLVRRLVEMHGGRVEAHSAGPGLGATFSVRLPLASPQAPQTTVVPVKNDERAVAGLRVLVVDDDPPVAESMCILLELEGHEVRCAHSGDAALELLKTFRPEVVLLDIGLPGQDGYTVARRIRDQPEGNNIRLVAVSGYGHEEAIVRSREAGFDCHLVKPVEPASLLALLAEFGGQRT